MAESEGRVLAGLKLNIQYINTIYSYYIIFKMLSGEQLREQCKSTICDILKEHYRSPNVSNMLDQSADNKEEQDRKDCVLAASQFERACFNKVIADISNDGSNTSWSNPKFREHYHYISIAIYNNLDPNSTVGSSHMLSLLASGKSPYDILKMPIHEWSPANSQQMRYEMKVRAGQKMIKKTSTLYLCSVCHYRETTYTERQTRASDEPATLYIDCVNCGHHWRI